MADNTTQPKRFVITLLGDLMLGRLIDQCLPTHVNEPEEARLVSHFRQKHAQLQSYTHQSPWGNALPLFRKSDLILGNLETSVTTHDVKWPDKVFNYRMHPDNIRCLVEAGIDYVSLANNHTLDFSQEGLIETVQMLKKAGIAFAGAGETAVEANSPAELMLKHKGDATDNGNEGHKIRVYSFSDHPSDWAGIDRFSFLQYTSGYRSKLKDLLTANRNKPSLKIVSVHWGPNYGWQPGQHIRDMAHFFIDSCEVDVVWGHSSHHIQGVEIYKGKPIIYGCGDFVDDYAVNQQYRNDLSAAWTLTVEESTISAEEKCLRVTRLDVRPNRIRQFQAGLLDRNDSDHEWVTQKFKQLCGELSTRVDDSLGVDDQIVVDLADQKS